MMNKKTSELSLLDSLSPELLLNYIHPDEIVSLNLTKKNRIRSIEEIDIHFCNVKRNGGDIIGFKSLRKCFESDKSEGVYILSGYDDKYGFDLYLDGSKSRVIGVAIIKLRTKSEEEIRWERDILGIKHP